MKIAMVFDMMLWGGIERVGVSYIKLFQNLGHHVDVYILNPKTKSIVNEISEICNAKILNFRKRACPDNWWSIVEYKNFHGFELFVFLIMYFGLSAFNKITKRKYSIKIKYDFAIAFSGHINDLTYVANNYIRAKYKVAWLHGSQSSYFMLSPGFFRLYRKITNLVCLSDLGDIECEMFNKKYHILKKKIYNPCIINEGEKNIKKITSLKKKYGDYCLMVARLSDDKDQQTVILALKYLHEKYNMKKHLVLVGDGDKKTYLEKLVSKLKIGKWVHFEGNQKDVINYYLSAGILVHAAPLEGLPTVFLEAMYFGLPIVTTDAMPGAREVLGNNEFGLISPIKSYSDLAANISKLYNDSYMRDQFVIKGRERIKDFYPEVIEKQVISLFQDIVREK